MGDTLKGYLILGLAVAIIVLGSGWATHALVLKGRLLRSENAVQEGLTKILVLNSDLEVAKSANLRLEGSLGVQNAEINRWLVEAENRRLSARTTLAIARAEGEKWRVRYAKLLDSPPTNPSNECESLELRLTQYLDMRSAP